MKVENFYLTLPSNSSFTYFPHNKTTNFSTKLPKSIQLEGEWSVGIVEFQYPCTMFTVQDNNNIMYITKQMKDPNEAQLTRITYKSHIPTSSYENIEDVITALNSRESFKLRHDKISKLVTLTGDINNLISLKFSPVLSLQLGFDPNTDVAFKRTGKFPANLYLGLPSQLYIYCDIVEPQMVGDVMSPLLRIVSLDPIKYVYGSNKMHVFSPPHYIPVMRREFDTIEIDIRSDTGENIPFQFGTSCVKLHFIRR